MTELEQQLTNALTALSKQYEAEMEQQAERVGELQQQLGRSGALVEDLKERVELLAEDYSEIAEVLSGTTAPAAKVFPPLVFLYFV